MLKIILLKTLTLLSCLLWVFSSKAQSFYSFTVASEPYVELSGATLLSGTFTSDNYQIPLSKPLKAFNQITGNNLIVGKNAYIVSTATSYSFAFDPLVMSLSKLDNTSSLSYTVSPVINDTVVTIQWKNMKLDSGFAGDYINMQCKIHYPSQTIEFHYGPSQTQSPRYSDSSLSNLIGVFLLSPDFNTAYDYNWLHGDAASPQVSNDPQKEVKLIGLPANGTVYRFSRKSGTGFKSWQQNNVSFYPNPATERVYIASSDNNPQRAVITDAAGKTIIIVNDVDLQGIDISSLRAGIYFITVENQWGQSTQKFIKQ